jgi:hypothetical protein
MVMSQTLLLVPKIVMQNAAQETFNFGDWSAQGRQSIASVLTALLDLNWVLKNARSSTSAAEDTAKAHLYLPMERSFIIMVLEAFHLYMSQAND